jgi:hypothetical protein
MLVVIAVVVAVVILMLQIDEAVRATSSIAM